MAADIFVLLLNPAISLILAAALAVVWAHRRAARFMGVAAIGLLCFALAFIIQDIAPPLPWRLSSLLTNLGFLATFTLLCAAVIQMAGGTLPWRSLGLVAIVTVLAILYWLYVEESLAFRVHTMNVSHSIMCLITIAAAWLSPRRGWGRNLTLAVVGLGLVNFIWRPLLVVWEGNAYLSQEAFHQSIYWNTTRFGSPILAVFAALALLVGLAMLLIKDLWAEARTDKLSGCLNRRGFEEQAQIDIAAAEKERKAKAVVICDIDRFKQINDGFGHAQGDAVIAAFGQAMQDAMPQATAIGRIGGEEFAALLVGEDAWQAPRLVAACRTAFAEHIRALGIGPVTASFGIYNCGQGDSLDVMLSRADNALYEAKNAGRDTVRTHRAPLRTVKT